jgi:ubiquinone/menaquinone biosynthesis C-methylase UbiE
MKMANSDFSCVTEMAGDLASFEQIERLNARYAWAAEFSKGADVLEVACGAGQGLGYLAKTARHVVGGDITQSLVDAASQHYGNRVKIIRFSAEDIPFPDNAFDVVLLFEAIYYLSDVRRFFHEARRILRPNGKLLIVTANKDLYDFTPSPHSVAYFGVVELASALRECGFDPQFYGNTPVSRVSWRQKLLRPIKLLLTRSGLMPESKRKKAILKRFVFGKTLPMPREINPDPSVVAAPSILSGNLPDRVHKVLFVEAKLL